jgi:hypothetical protein
MAKVFVDKKINRKFIEDYLENILEVGSLCELSLLCSRQGKHFSRSHYNWLMELSVFKLKWGWHSKVAEKKKMLDHLVNELMIIQTHAKEAALIITP